MATRIIAVLNQKGGVGKTTTCVNLGAALARRGRRVLLVDMDPQANLSVHVGMEPHKLTKTTYSLLLGKHGLAEAVQPTDTPGLFVVPSTLGLANAEIQLASTVGRELVLREALEEWLHPAPEGQGPGGAPLPFGQTPAVGEADAPGRPSADFVLIDCPPSLGTLTMNALCAAGEVLLPIQTEFFALQGVAGILESVKAVQRLNRGLRLSMVVPSMVDRRTTLARDVLDEVRGYFGDVVTKTEIRKNVKLAEAPSHGRTIFGWDARSNGAEDYDHLAAEVLGELEQTPAPAASESRPAAAESAAVAETTTEPSESAQSAGSASTPASEAASSTVEPGAPAEPCDAAGPVAADPAAAPAAAPDPAPAPAETAPVAAAPATDPQHVALADLPDTRPATPAADPDHVAFASPPEAASAASAEVDVTEVRVPLEQPPSAESVDDAALALGGAAPAWPSPQPGLAPDSVTGAGPSAPAVAFDDAADGFGGALSVAEPASDDDTTASVGTPADEPAAYDPWRPETW